MYDCHVQSAAQRADGGPPPNRLPAPPAVRPRPAPLQFAALQAGGVYRVTPYDSVVEKSLLLQTSLVDFVPQLVANMRFVAAVRGEHRGATIESRAC